MLSLLWGFILRERMKEEKEEKTKVMGRRVGRGAQGKQGRGSLSEAGAHRSPAWELWEEEGEGRGRAS